MKEVGVGGPGFSSVPVIARRPGIAAREWVLKRGGKDKQLLSPASSFQVATTHHSLLRTFHFSC